MELGTALLNTFVVLAVGTALTYLTNDRFRTLRREIDQVRDELRTELRTEIGGLRSELGGLRDEMRAEIGGLRGEIAVLREDLRGDIRRLDAAIDALRSDLTQVALAVGARGRTAEG
jgi:uncharacterized protein involved in exopolysaccharide biosynthesis